MFSAALLGAGQMAEAFVRGLLRAELVSAGDVWVSDIRQGRPQQLAAELSVNAATSNLDAVSHAEIVLLSVKPQDVPSLLDDIGADVRSDHLVISIAGIHAMERGGIRALIMDAIVAAAERSAELGRLSV